MQRLFGAIPLPDEDLILFIKVIPKSRKSEIVGWENEELKIRIAAPPDKGQANEELIRFLAKSLGIGKSRVKLLSGDTSRHKKILLEGISKLILFSRVPAPK